ncbi:F-box/kelch-repeat protein At3g23880-like [Lotus japonicus]|uniref:F-box/kelch-repeat protein At3g23880-like n=1 Tax=Lotus japonicus TaxID=34305 RepID=UPI00258783B7|nr:F-box/kelch-repeat protein At3g23880-like [Lotus japonicus]
MRPCNNMRQHLEHIVAPSPPPPPPPPPPPSPVLPHELILEILSLLPVKPLIQFKSVCKSWNSLISDPQFAKLHLRRSSPYNTDFTHLQLLFSCKPDDSNRKHASSCSVSSLIQNPSPNLPAQGSLFDLKDKCRVFGSCNGLISLVSFTKGELSIHIWNPATRTVSPNPPPLLLAGTIYKCSNFGFGYDCLTDTYKVVMCFARNSVHVYSLSDSSWRCIQPLPSFPNLGQGPQDGVYFSGSLNWVACDEWGSVQFHIVSLDLGKETYTRLAMPGDHIGTEPLLGVLRGFLCLSDDYEQTHFVIWRMNEFGVGGSWTRLVNVSYDYLDTSGYPNFHLGMNVLCMSENDDILMVSYLDQSQAILYNRRDNSLQRIEFPNNISFGCNVKYYLESLISPC